MSGCVLQDGEGDVHLPETRGEICEARWPWSICRGRATASQRTRLVPVLFYRLVLFKLGHIILCYNSFISSTHIPSL
jgi:hypothetical protein